MFENTQHQFAWSESFRKGNERVIYERPPKVQDRRAQTKILVLENGKLSFIKKTSEKNKTN